MTTEVVDNNKMLFTITTGVSSVPLTRYSPVLRRVTALVMYKTWQGEVVLRCDAGGVTGIARIYPVHMVFITSLQLQ